MITYIQMNLSMNCCVLFFFFLWDNTDLVWCSFKSQPNQTSDKPRLPRVSIEIPKAFNNINAAAQIDLIIIKLKTAIDLNCINSSL